MLWLRQEPVREVLEGLEVKLMQWVWVETWRPLAFRTLFPSQIILNHYHLTMLLPPYNSRSTRVAWE